MYLFVISQNVALYCAYPVDLEKRKEGKNTLKLKNEANLQSVAIQYYSNHTITIHKTSLIRKKKLIISIQIDSTLKEVLLRWAQ